MELSTQTIQPYLLCFPYKLNVFLLTPATSEYVFCLLPDFAKFIDIFYIKLPGKSAKAAIIAVN